VVEVFQIGHYNFQMFGDHQILVSTSARRWMLSIGLAAGALLLGGCGQKGPLYLPTGEAAAGRASLPQTLAPSAVIPAQAASAPARPPTGTAAPVRQP
jgi:predicted small lipoprotein YifL